jgi:hypothetical protein
VWTRTVGDVTGIRCSDAVVDAVAVSTPYGPTVIEVAASPVRLLQLTDERAGRKRWRSLRAPLQVSVQCRLGPGGQIREPIITSWA